MSDDHKFYTIKSRISRTKIHQRSYLPDDITIISCDIIDADEYEDRYEPIVDLFYELISEEGDFD